MFRFVDEELRATRALVFSQYRLSVSEITDCLKLFDGVLPVEFKGQGDGNKSAGRKNNKKQEEPEENRRKSTGRITQKKQKEIVEAYKAGR